ncbi:MAG: hypothetical protein CEE40_02795 [Chloroflexi bacterium B3_Chlor]|nr:MAG: hypothetical protein CEE40_02795 [Chloroflexi bacterium B3_Chlor]
MRPVLYFQALRTMVGRPRVISLAGLIALFLACLYVYVLLALVWADTSDRLASWTVTFTPSAEVQVTRTPSPMPTRTATPSGPTATPTVTPTYTPISYTPTPVFLVYVVEAGDTLSGIARRYNTTVGAIMELNSLSTDLLAIGQELHIPGRRQAATPTPTSTATSTPPVSSPTPTGTPTLISPPPTATRQPTTPPQGGSPAGEPLVAAFYYAWYGLDQWAPGKVPDMPAVPYASRDRNTIIRHVEQAQRAGIDAFAVAWYGPKVRNNQTEANFRTMLEVAGERGFRATVYFETRSPFFDGQADVVDALRHLIDNHAARPAFLRYGGKPLIFFWAVGDVFTTQGQSAIDAWVSIRQQVDRGHKTLWIADGADIDFLRVFDGHHLYNITWNPPANVHRTLTTWGNRVRDYSARHGTGKLWVATAMPGYNDLYIQGRSNRFAHDRRNGAYYRETWQAAMDSAPDAIVITSFNEWLEGTQIEPSVSYGELYLQLTAEFSAAFKASRR